MKYITSQVGIVHTEHFVIDLGEEPVCVNFVQQVTDIIVSTPEGDILVSWDLEDDNLFTENNCMLVKVQDNLKEIQDDRCTKFYLMKKTRGDGKIIKVYITGTR